MDNINQTIFNIYENIQVFYKYRNLISLDTLMTKEELNTMIQRNKFVILKAIHKKDEEKKDMITDIINKPSKKENKSDIHVYYLVILYPNTDYDSKRSEFKKLMNMITYPRSDVMLISTAKKIGTHLQKFINKINEDHKTQTVYAYGYQLFKTIVPEYSLAPKYTILTDEEIKIQLDTMYIDKNSLPKILDTDPQMIWIGAKDGQIVRYEYLSEVTIHNIRYAKVIKNDN
jgi:DNA-directed RNA polymerase subunit H (RpoH/RPB5)